MSAPAPAPSPPAPPGDTANTGFILWITVVAAIGGFLFGFDSGVINGTVDGLQQAFASSRAGTGFNVASMLLGCAAGAFCAGGLADRFGRRGLLLCAAVCFAVSAWGSGVAQSAQVFVVFRVLGGLAVGAASVLAPAYISEVTPARNRGGLATIQQIAIITGLCCAFLSNYVIAAVAGGSTALWWGGYEAWRWMFWVELLPSLLFLCALLAIPESPRYLVARGKLDRAEAVLRRLFGEGARAKVVAIQASLAAARGPRMADVLHRRSGLRPIVWVGVGLAAFQQLVGINIVFYYGAVLWQSAGFAEGDALLINVVSGGVSIGACVGALLLVDRLGRKPLLLIGSAGMALTLGALAVLFALADVAEGGRLNLGPVSGPVALVVANLYVILFNLSWGPVMWVLLGEMFPNALRGAALAVSGLVQWLSNFAITLTFPLLLGGIGLGGAYGLYATFAAVSLLFVLLYLRETKGRELEDMEG